MCSYFNSIKVRLNLQRRTFEVMRFAFQFHKGTIKPCEVTLDKGLFR